MMKKVVLILCAICMLSFAVASPTGTATAGTYTSEMDDVLNVTEWSGVDAGNGLLFMDFRNVYNMPTIGGAKKLDNGMFIAGSLAVNFGSANDSSYYNGKVSTSEGETEASIFMNALLGVSNWGIKLSADFEPDTETSEDFSSDPAVKAKEKTGSTSITLSAGTTVAAGNGTVKPSFGFTYFSKNDESSSNEYPDSNPLYDTVNYDEGYYSMGFFGKIVYLTAEEDSIQHRFGATLSFSKVKYNDSDYAKSITSAQSSEAGSSLGFSPFYAFMYSPSETISFTAESLLNINNTSSVAGKSEQSDTTVNFYEDLGAVYKISDRFQLNGGAKISCSIETEKSLYDGKTLAKKTTFGSRSTLAPSVYYQTFDTTPYFGASFSITPNLKAEVSVMSSTSIAITYKF